MKKLNSFLLILLSALQIFISASCTGRENLNTGNETGYTAGQYTVYIINNNLHTGIVIPVDDESSRTITALKYFKNFRFTDIGWGEEKFYQNPKDNFCMGARAVLLPNTSVIRIEGYSNTADSFIGWSDYTVRLTLSKDQYIKLIRFIENSFKKDTGDTLFITSEKYSGEIIFFKSVYRYCLFNTCNTWVAEALKSSGLDVSPFFIITASQLYREIRNQGTVLKPLKGF